MFMYPGKKKQKKIINKKIYKESEKENFERTFKAKLKDKK